MFALTKVYKSKAMAVNAIRMTATNKGWKVLNTDDAAAHVWPQAEGFEVNNTTLNLALGFITDAEAALAQRVPEGSVTDGKALEVVNAALAEQANKDAKAPKLPAAKAAKVNVKTKSDVKPEQAEGRETRCNVVNGARRPLRGKTLMVWETTEMLAAGPNGTPMLKEVYEELCRLEPGFNKTTAGIQYYACRAYNGWESKK